MSTTSLWWEGTSLPKSPSPSHVASGATQNSPDPYPQKVVRLSSSPQGLIQTNLAPAVLRRAHSCSWCAVLMPWNSIYLTCTLQNLQWFQGSRSRGMQVPVAVPDCWLPTRGYPTGTRDCLIQRKRQKCHFQRLFASLTGILNLTVTLRELYIRDIIIWHFCE